MKTVYLAVLPKHRRPKAVSASSVGWYQLNSRYFYEAPNMTADQARKAIQLGHLKPTWVDGKKVVAYDLATGKGRTETRLTLGDALREVEVAGPDAVLQIGSTIYTPHHAFAHGQERLRWKYAWHKADISGMLYSDAAMSWGDLEKHMANGDRWSVALLREDDSHGIPMGGIVAASQAHLSLKEIFHHPNIQRLVQGIGGRRWGLRALIEGDRLERVDLASLEH